MDVAALRSQIKQWEYAFKANNNRHPTVQDIKHEPAIAEKYKLYKKLNKANQPSAIPASSQLSVIPPKSRAVMSTAPLLTSNPFSPVRIKGKQRDPSPSPSFSQPAHPNPFATPSKDKSRHRFRQPRDPSPDLIPPIPALSPSRHSLPGTQREMSAVSRARKRLRGEPVSPSPIKEKRARMVPQASLPFGKYATLHDSDDNDDRAGRALANDDEAFLDDSPVKQPTSGKVYVPLFEETVQTDRLSQRKIVRSHSKLMTEILASATRTRPRAASPTSDDEDEGWLQKGKIKALDVSSQSLRKGQSLTRAAGASSSTRSSRATNDLPLKLPSSVAHAGGPSSNNTQRPSLLPPSPPPKDSSRTTKPNYIGKSVRKGKAIARNKARKSDGHTEQESDSPEDEDMSVEVVPWKRQLNQRRDEDLPEDWNPVPRQDSALPVVEDPGEVEINLPDELKRVLDISIDDAKVRDTTEQILAKQLIYGSRVMQYDARKGGQVWDVGEEEATDVRAVGDEDEWEGEPVPWEVGEL